jgi:hypothetical protein
MMMMTNMKNTDNDEYFCLICEKASKRCELGPEEKFGIFSCPQCGSAHCGEEDCCGTYQFEPIETLD